MFNGFNTLKSTTGETVNQCVRVLKKDGRAREVVVLTVARTVAC